MIATLAKRWNETKANAWYDKLPWLVGCNYTPRNAGNQLDMWQAETFSPDLIDEELGWAESIGFNSLRVFLHDLLWQTDRKGFVSRIEQFLDIADRHGIGIMFVFFDSCWHPFPCCGPQPQPMPGVHNSCWLQSPGVGVLREPETFGKLEGYVSDIVRHFRGDSRVQVWDIWNEPDNPNAASRGPQDLGHAKADIVAPLMERAFEWARSAKPAQPLTSGIWLGDWSSEYRLRQIERLQVELSDVVSFHNYGPPEDMEQRIRQLKRYNRPLLCTEYMSRGSGSTFAGCLPILKKHKVAAYNWGFVAGKTQTHYPWDSWQRPYTSEPDPWFHEIFREDGTPYRDEETKLIAKLTARGGRSARRK
jgi:hypothetical protein